MHTEYVDYRDGDVTCEGYAAYDESRRGPLPGVLVSHTWAGQGDAERREAERLASLGYVGFAVDIYGKGLRGGSPDENARLMQPFVDDRAALAARINAAFEALERHPRVDAERRAAIGYCFGGLCVLDLARSAPQGLRGVVSVHGMLHAPHHRPQVPITAKVLVLHGYDDPMAPPDHLRALATELTEAGADWQVHAYGRTMHAFTNPHVAAPERGLAYNPTAARRAQASMIGFLEEVLTSS